MRMMRDHLISFSPWQTKGFVVKKGSGTTEPQRKEQNVARIAGVNIPTAKRVPIALTYITGIGHTSAKQICEAVNIDMTRRINELG